MDGERVEMLINLLVDPSARVDERDDAAIDLGSSDDPRAIDALLRVGSDANENQTLLSTCGESLAQIAVRAERLDPTWATQLATVAANELLASVRAERPDLLEP